jgi:hypothetical protein
MITLTLFVALSSFYRIGSALCGGGGDRGQVVDVSPPPPPPPPPLITLECVDEEKPSPDDCVEWDWNEVAM